MTQETPKPARGMPEKTQESLKLVQEALDLTKCLRDPDLSTALRIMQWELGDLAKAVTYMEWHDEKLHPAYKSEAKLALGSLIFQIRVCCALLGIDLQEASELGVATIKERIEDMMRKSGRFQHYVGGKK